MAEPSFGSTGIAQDRKALLSAYCARIGYTGPLKPTLAVLAELLARQADAIAFEGIDALLGRGVDIAPAAVDAKLLHSARGGYCYEQNSLLHRVLEAVGFCAEGLLARVVWGMAPDAPVRAPTHQALRAYAEGAWWLVDAGFGNSTPTAPLRMDTQEPQDTPHGAYRFRPKGQDWQLEAQQHGDWLPVYRIVPGTWLPGDYETANWYTSTYPASLFRNRLFVTRTAAEARYVLLGARFTVRRVGEQAEHRILDASGIADVLETVFNLPVIPEWQGMIAQAAKDIPEA